MITIGTYDRSRRFLGEASVPSGPNGGLRDEADSVVCDRRRFGSAKTQSMEPPSVETGARARALVFE